MHSLLQDLWYGVRTLRKSPGFTAIAVLTLGLGVGANTVIFSVVNAVMLRPLPYDQPDRLMMLFHSYSKLGIDLGTVSPHGYSIYNQNARSFSSMGAYTGFRAPQNLTGNGEPERVKTLLATASLFQTLGVRPLLGRTYTDEEDQAGKPHVAVLSYGLWQRRFGGDRNILGKQIRLDGTPYEVIGVMPNKFQIPIGLELWVPMAWDGKGATDNTEYLSVVARLKLGVTPQKADAEMRQLSEQVLLQFPELRPSGFSALAELMTRVVQGPLRGALIVLFAAVGLVVLIACANIANLLLARSVVRQKEVAIRTSLGATRMRLVRQVLTESLLLASLGGAVGLVLGYWGIGALFSLVPIELPTFAPFGIDRQVLAFTFGLTLITGLLFGIFPALALPDLRLGELLKQGGRGSSTGEGHQLFKEALVVSEFALALVLLVSAGLMIRSFIGIMQRSPGFDPINRLTASIQLRAEQYRQPEQRNAFYQQLLQRTSALPGVKQAAIGSILPLLTDSAAAFMILDHPMSPEPHANTAIASPQYFSTLGIALLSGRGFTERDRLGSPPVAIIDEKLARMYFRGENPIGRQIRIVGDTNNPPAREIIGVVAGVSHSLQDDIKGQIYVPFWQVPVRGAFVVVQTQSDPTAMVSNLRRIVAQLDPNLAVYDTLTMSHYVDRFIAQPRFNMVLLGVFGGLALVLASVGVYGVISYWVTQRTHEIGVRIALGAQSAEVQRMVLWNSLRLAILGIAIGLAGALAATRALRGLVFGVSTHDPFTFIALASLLAAIALLASYLPARRATRIDPIVALRYE
jgi:putative ABC transport system permease protein